MPAPARQAGAAAAATSATYFDAMLSTPSTPASSSPPSPYLPQHVTVPLFGDYDSPKELHSPSLPSFPADRKLQQASLRWRPSSRLALPLTVLFLAATSLVLLASNFLPSPSPAGTYYDSLYEVVSSSPSPERIRRWFSQPPERPLQKEGIVVVEAKADHTVTALCLHGLGGHGADWPFYQTLSKRYPFVRWVSPTAEYKDVTVRDGERVRAWFDISTFDDLYQDEDIKGYAHSAQQINQLVEQERALLISQGKEPRIVMMGFSQGGVMTLLSTLLSQDPSLFEAAVVFSTYLPMIDNIASLIHPAARDLPLLWAHGRADSYLTYAHAQEGVDLLRSEKVGMKNVDFRGYDGLQHAWAHHELSDLVDWFGRHIPFYRTHPSSSSSPSAVAAPFLAYVGGSVDHSFPFTDDERKEMKATEEEPLAAGEAKVEERAVEDENAKVEAEPTARKVRMSKRHGQWDGGVRRLRSTMLSV